MNALGTVCLAGWLGTGLQAGESLLDQIRSTIEGPQRHLLVRCVDEAGKPVAAVSLNVRIDSSETDYQGDADDKIRVRLPAEDPPYLRLRTKATGYVSVYAAWRNRETKDPVPAEFTFPMRRGVSIGGTVRNEAGEPVDGADLALSLSLKEEPQGRVRPSMSGYRARTDAHGQWRCHDVPKGLARVSLRLDHPDYVSDYSFLHRPSATVDQLVDMTAVVVMKKGIAVEGTVTNEDGTAVAGATVAQGGDRFGSDLPTTTTDANGRYRFAHSNPGPMVLTVVAPGWAPDLRQIKVHADLGPVDFRLEKGRTVRVRVVDADGEGLQGVWMAPDTWREHRTLTRRGVPRETGAEGRWVWDWAPGDEVLFDLLKQGFMSIRRQSLLPREEEYVITLHRPLEVSGRVVDAESKEPIKAFRVVPGSEREGRPPSWRRYDVKDGKNGEYSVQFSEPRPKYLVKVEADGYLPTVSRSFSADEGKATFDFELTPGTGPEGVVLDHEGNPVEGAQVYLCSGSGRPYVKNGRNIHDREAVKAKTGADGKFRLPPQTEAYSLLVLHDAGFAEVTQASLARASEIRLVQWARVEGVLRVGSGPGVQKEMSLQVERPHEVSNMLQAYFDYDAGTDAEGRFTFERALPGKASICQ
ncbi:MAG: carboxypeptidase regulatory-like domain-containing protein, partial [Planctomycetota bacterium]